MSVLLETSLGDITVDLFADKAPKCSENFLKLCKAKYYNFSPIHSVQPNFSFQSGDPIGPGSKDSDGGTSIWGLLNPSSANSKAFTPEFHASLKHSERGTLSMATAPSVRDPDQREAGSQFIITLGDGLEYLDGKAAVFGQVVEGFDTLERINNAFLDETGRPLQDIRLRHTIVLEEEGIPDPPGFVDPAESPVPTAAQLATVRIPDDEKLDPDADQETVEKLRREREARAQALTLEMVGDLPFAEVAPPENVLFVCKLNPITRDEDLELIFSRFGKILSCEVIRDKKTGDSLQYAFLEFQDKKSAEEAYFKMGSVLIDDRRIHVDFSQSVSRLADVWRDSTNKKRSAGRGGFGGIEGLERKRQYRAQYDEEEKSTKKEGRYGLVFGRDNAKNSGLRAYDRDERSIHRHRNRNDNFKARGRSRSRSPQGKDNKKEKTDSRGYYQHRRSSSREHDRRHRSREHHRDDSRSRR